MIRCMPVRCSPSDGPASKPRRLSISAWFSTRCGVTVAADPAPSSPPSVSAPQAAASSSSVWLPLIAR